MGFGFWVWFEGSASGFGVWCEGRGVCVRINVFFDPPQLSAVWGLVQVLRFRVLGSRGQDELYRPAPHILTSFHHSFSGKKHWLHLSYIYHICYSFPRVSIAQSFAGTQTFLHRLKICCLVQTLKRLLKFLLHSISTSFTHSPHLLFIY